MTEVIERHLKAHPEDLEGRARELVTGCVLQMLDIELNKVQTQTVYVLFPTTFENREAARERGFQGERIGEIGKLLEDLGHDAAADLMAGMSTIEGAGRRPAFFRTPIEDWDDFLMFRYLRDRARSFWALGYLGSDYVPLAVLVARTFMHCAFSSPRPVSFTVWTRHQIDRIQERVDRGGGSRLQQALSKWYPLAKAIISSANEDEEMAAGLRNRRSTRLVELFADTVIGELGPLGLAVPDVRPGPASDPADEIYRNASDPVPAEMRARLVKLLKMHLSAEYTTAFMEKLRPPTAYDLAEWMQTIREEGEHGDGIVEILADLGEDAQPIVYDMRFGEGRHLLDFFKVEIENWDEVGVMRWLSECAAGYQSLAALGSRYVPFAVWSARNYIDEGMEHAQIGRAIVENAINAGRRDDVQRLMWKRWPYVVDYFGNERPDNEYVVAGIKVRPNRELRRRWLAVMQRDAAHLKLAMPPQPLKGVRADYGMVPEA